MPSYGPDRPWPLRGIIQHIKSLAHQYSPHSPPLPIAKKICVNLHPNATGQTSLPAPSSSSDHQRQSLHDAHRIVSNYVVTTQYSLLTFVPKNLYHQFRRVANFFFLMIVILQCIEPFQSLEPAVSALPLIIIVGLTMARDGFEDWKRHEVDQTVNYRQTLALHNWRNTTMEEKMKYHHRKNSWPLLGVSGWNQASTTLGRGGTSSIAKHVKGILQALWQRLVSIQRALTSALRSSSKPGTEGEPTAHNTIPLPQQLKWSMNTADHTPTIGLGYRYLERNNCENGWTSSQVGELYQLLQPPPENDFSQPYWRTRLWKDVQEGDFILLRQDDIIPADILILSSSEQEPICYVETKNLDGETNLKIRRCVPGLGDLRSPEDCAKRQFWVESEGPTNNLLRYHGAVVFLTRAKNLDASSTQEQEQKEEQEQDLVRVGIDMNHLLLRGCVLRNTPWVIGLVVFTGADTKLQMNAGQVPSKRSNIERKMNFQIVINLVILAAICCMFALLSNRWETTYLNKGAPFTTTDPTSHYHNPAYATFISFMMSVITFQNLVPVALYLTVEGVKTIQAYFIYQDQALYYEDRDVACVPRSWNLSDDLGQIEYIFSDKTGTLTTNQMEFKKCSIQGHVFEYTAIPSVEASVDMEAEASTESIAGRCDASNELPPSKGHMEVLEDEDDFMVHGNERHAEGRAESCAERNQTRRRSSQYTLVSGDRSAAKSAALSSHAVQIQQDNRSETGDSGDDSDTSDHMFRSRSSSDATAVHDHHTSHSQRTPSALSKSSQRPQLLGQQAVSTSTKQPAFALETRLHSSTRAADPTAPDLDIARDLQKAKDYFFLNLGICHTVLVSATAAVSESCGTSSSSTHHCHTQGYFPTPHDADYQAQSPDELALVIASKGLGYTFLGRQVDTIFMAHPQEREPRRYKVLHVLEFNSTRKRMSVIVRRQRPQRDSTSPTISGAAARKNDTDAREEDHHHHDHHNDDEEELLLLTKGADNIIIERVASGQQPLIHETTLHLQGFARDGLRTLCLAYKVLDPAIYRHWAERYHLAATFVEGTHADNHHLTRRQGGSDTDPALASMHNHTSVGPSNSNSDPHPSTFATKTRQSMLEDLAEEMERDLQLLGATGIEDRLQDGVPETIRLIKRAGIKVWVLTGDKMETAISIGVSTGLLSHCSGRHPSARGEDGDGEARLADSMAETSKSPEAVRDEGSDGSVKDMEPLNGFRGSHCPDMELILIRGDAEFNQTPESDDPISSSDSKLSVKSSKGSEQHEHPVMTGIKNALKTFTPLSKGTDTLARRHPDTVDNIVDETTSTKSEQDTRSGFGYFVPWRTRVKMEAPSFTRSIGNSVSSRRRSSTLIGRPMSEQAPQVREGQNTALVIDGLALKYALEDPECKPLLLELACHCSSVICCRVSPLQKAMVVKMVKEAKKVMTLSIGDGANDVSMIQEAHIGIGVAGEEGLQAVMASDYSIGQFRFLARLLLVHGHYAYLRNTSMVMLFIYKNIIGIGVLFCYEFVCGFSSVPVFEYSYVLLYNVVLTVFPALIIGIFDRDMGPGVLMTFPELYKVGLLQQEFTNTRFAVYSLEGTFQSILCFLIPYFAYQQGAVDSSGLVQEMYEMGLAMAVASILQANVFAAVVSQSFCVFHILFIWGSVALIVVYSALYALMPRALSQWNPNYGFTFSVMGSLTFWAVVALTLLACNIPRLTARFIRRTWWPSDLDILQEVCQEKCADPHTLLVSEVQLNSSSITSASTSNQALGSDSQHKVNPSGLSTDIVPNGRAYSALCQHWRLDWIWGFMPSSAPTAEQGPNAHAVYQGIGHGTSSFITSTATSLVDPVPLSFTLTRADLRQPNGSSTSLASSAPSRSRVASSTASLSPSLKRFAHASSVRSKDRDSVSMRSSTEPSSGTDVKTLSVGLFPSGPTVLPVHRQHPSSWHEDFSRESDSSDLRPGSTLSQRTSVTRRTNSLLSSNSNRSASPPVVPSGRSPQIGVSDPWSMRSSPTPILGFGFAQEEGMADLILGTRFYSQRDHSPDASTSGTADGRSSTQGADQTPFSLSPLTSQTGADPIAD
ncbi:unnamed protein product [Mortierella alpina]